MLRECGGCERLKCGACGWKGVRKADERVQLCGKCGSGLVYREPSRHVMGGRCRYAKATNESDSGREARDACAEGEGRMAMGIGGEGVQDEEGGAATGAGDPAEVHGRESAGAEGVGEVVCEECRSAPGDTFSGEHVVCDGRGCACATCARVRDEVARKPLPRWTVDSRTTNPESLASAMAFRKPNGDTVAVMRNALCPTCSVTAVLFLADGDVVSFVRTRHGSCDMMPARL